MDSVISPKVAEAGTRHASGRVRRSPLALRLMLAASSLLPVLLLLAAAWRDHDRMEAGARADVERLAAVAHEHALKVLETNALVLDRLEDRIRGMSWPEVAAQGAELHRWMRTLDEQIAQIIALHLVQPDGETSVISLAYPTPPLNLTSRGYFRAMAAGEAGILLGEPFRSPLTGKVSVVIGRGLYGPNGEFRGAVLGALLADYFEAQWRAMDASGRAAFGLVRTDGVTLIAHPAPGTASGAAPDPAAIMRAVGPPISDAGAIGRIGERHEGLASLQRIGQYPLAVTVAIDLDQVRAAWWRGAALPIMAYLIVTIALIFATVLAIRRWNSEQAVLAELRDLAEELRGEISRREAAEDGLRQAQRLEALGRLTGGVAHDFNNLLTAVLGAVTLLERHLGAAVDDKARRLLGAAREAVARGARLNAGLLAFARRQPLRPVGLDASALLRGFQPLLQQALGEAVSLTLELADNLPPCRADAAQLEAAMLNLAINARDAMPLGGSLTLTTGLIWLDAAALGGNTDAQPGEFIAIAVTDTGEGMPAAVRSRAFEPFFTTKPVGKGTGLGLSQVFGFVRQLGGHVSIDSTPGLGTTVTLFIAREDALRQPDDSAASRQSPVVMVSRRTVLLAEDDNQVREVAAELLRDAGFRVITASDGREALALLRRGEPVDMLFADVVMPGGVSGFDLGLEARRLRPGMPILLTSGYAGMAAAPEARDFEVLPKPYEREALVARLTTMLGAPGQASKGLGRIPS